MNIANLNTARMSTKEIAALTDKRHGDVLRDVRNMLSQIHNADLRYESFQELKDYRGFTAEILLDKDLTICLVAGYDANVRFKIIKRWQELENQQPQFTLPKNFSEALRMLADETDAHQETKAQLEHKTERLDAAASHIKTALEVMTVTVPKAKAFDEVLDKGENLLISEAAKTLGVKQHDLFGWLSTHGWIFRRGSKPWQAYADKIHNQLLAHRYTTGTGGDGVPHTKCQVMVTPAGIVVLRALLGA